MEASNFSCVATRRSCGRRRAHCSVVSPLVYSENGCVADADSLHLEARRFVDVRAYFSIFTASSICGWLLRAVQIHKAVIARIFGLSDRRRCLPLRRRSANKPSASSVANRKAAKANNHRR